MAERYAPDQSPVGARRALLDRTPHGARVLDIGCWSGFNGRYLMQARGARMVGVEPDARMAQLAARTYDEVHQATVEVALDEHLGAERFDVVLLLDVLEHMVDPLEVLRRLRAHAVPECRFLVSLPNVAHWSVRKMVLTGRWEYQDSGLMDRTHLHFYTAQTAQDLLREAGLEVDHRDVALDRPPLLALRGRALRLLAPWPGLFAAQLLFEAHASTAAS